MPLRCAELECAGRSRRRGSAGRSSGCSPASTGWPICWKEKHRCDLVLIDFERKRQADRRVNLKNMAHELDQATEFGMHAIVEASQSH